MEKVQEAIKHELSNLILLEVKDPRVKFVTVTDVELSNDMSVAKVYVSTYGTDEQQEMAMRGLKHSLGFLRTEIAKRIRLRFAPELVLKRDTSLAYGEHIEKLLHQAGESDRQLVEARIESGISPTGENPASLEPPDGEVQP